MINECDILICCPSLFILVSPTADQFRLLAIKVLKSPCHALISPYHALISPCHAPISPWLTSLASGIISLQDQVTSHMICQLSALCLLFVCSLSAFLWSAFLHTAPSTGSDEAHH